MVSWPDPTWRDTLQPPRPDGSPYCVTSIVMSPALDLEGSWLDQDEQTEGVTLEPREGVTSPPLPNHVPCDHALDMLDDHHPRRDAHGRVRYLYVLPERIPEKETPNA